VAQEQISQTPLLKPIASAIVIVLPLAEIITAVLLFLPSTRRLGLLITIALMTAFTGYIVYILIYDKELPCTCGGILEEMTWPQHLIFNIACVATAFSCLFVTRNTIKRNGLPDTTNLAHR
jgi:hypothetical protein